MTSEIKKRCIHKDCVADCPRKRPVTTDYGYCMHYTNGVKRNSVSRKCLSGKET